MKTDSFTWRLYRSRPRFIARRCTDAPDQCREPYPKAYRRNAEKRTDLPAAFRAGLFHLKAALYHIKTNSVGETLRNFDLNENDLIIADRICATPTGMAHCLERGADFILRVRRGAFTLLDKHGKAMELDFFHITDSDEKKRAVFPDKAAQLPRFMRRDEKEAEALERTKRRLKQKECKKQITVSEETRLFNEYIVLITPLLFGIAYQDILELYRFRWQAEIYFKRLKSILDFGELPKKTPESAMA